jgi:hypothetical protein
MVFKFHGAVKTEGAVAVACSDLLGGKAISPAPNCIPGR